MTLIRIATPADAASILDIYAPYIENTSYTFETEVPTVDAFQERIVSYLQDWPWLVCEIDEVIRIPFAGIEALWQSTIIRLRYTPVTRFHNGPRGFDTGERIRPPMDEHSEFGRAKPRCAFVSKRFPEPKTGQT